jgi:hypothetical protein
LVGSSDWLIFKQGLAVINYVYEMKRLVPIIGDEMTDAELLQMIREDAKDFIDAINAGCYDEVCRVQEPPKRTYDSEPITNDELLQMIKEEDEETYNKLIRKMNKRT